MYGLKLLYRTIYKLQEEAFAKLEDGTTVIINSAYVTGATSLEAWDAFHQKYGENITLGYAFDVNAPIFIGGGIV